MAELNKELAKIYLEQRGYLAALDVPHEEGGPDAAVFDVVGVEILRGTVSQAVVGVVRGWWHAGSYLTPGLIRSHLQTDRKLLSESFAPERIQYVRDRFGLGIAPIRNVLFFSQRSPGKSKDAERILASSQIEVVYLEDIIIDLLPRVGKIPLGEGMPAQMLSIIRYSRLFREMQKALQDAERIRTQSDGETAEKKTGSRSVPKEPEPQLDFIRMLATVRADDDGEE